MFMASELVNRLIVIHEHACSCSDCGTLSKIEVEECGGRVSRQGAAKRTLKNWSAMRFVLGLNTESILRHLSVQLTPTTAAVLAFQHGKLVFAGPLIKTKLNDYKMEFEVKSNNGNKHLVEKISLNHSVNDSACSKLGWPFGLKGASRVFQSSKVQSGEVGSKLASKSSAQAWPFCAEANADVFASGLEFGSKVEVHKSSIGWPLRQSSVFETLKTQHMPESETATTLTEISVSASRSSTLHNSEESLTTSIYSSYNANRNEQYFSSPIEKLQNDVHRILTNKTSDISLYSYKELQHITSDFSLGNLLGMGGSSRVYKGSLPNGKLVAVKIFKSYKEACEDFFTEINITSSLSHKHIMPLAGVCMDQDTLTTVYDLLPQGSLEEHLHGYKKKPGLPWEARFKIAVAIAEALMYLHIECPRPVIHRDVKSSNILLSNHFQPQLSDFGLAIWGQKSEIKQTVTRDVLGTFGYISPEYFMHGKVSDKIDVYSYGVVLLELLSGRKPVNLKAQKGQVSLVKWAKQLIDHRQVSSLLDPKLGDKLDANQIHKMVLAAYLCTSQSPEHRPEMKQVCKLLKGEISVKQFIQSEQNNINESQFCSKEEYELCSSPLSYSMLKYFHDSPSTITPRLHPRKRLSDCFEESDQHFKLADLLKQENH